jgi:hypothetical protein
MADRTRRGQSTELLQSLSGSSLSRLRSLADTLVDRVWGDVYMPRGPVPKDDLWRSCNDNLASMLQTINGAGPSCAVLLETARSTGTRRAQQRCPLAWVQHAWRTGGQVLWEDFAGQAGADNADELRWLVESAGTVWQVVEEFSAEMTATYHCVEQDLAGSHDRQTRDLLSALLDGRVAQAGGDVSRTLGLPAEGRFVVIVTEETSRVALRDLAQTLQLQGLRTVWHFRAGLHVGIAVLDGDAPHILLDTLGCSLTGRTGLSPVLRKLTEAPEGLRLAELAMSTVPPGAREAVTLDDRLPDALLISSPELAQRLVEVTLGPLLDLPAAERKELLATAGAWINSAGSAVQAARTLYCHRNTVVNRLARIQRLTGLNLADARCWSRVTLALSALRYQENRHQARMPGPAPAGNRGALPYGNAAAEPARTS